MGVQRIGRVARALSGESARVLVAAAWAAGCVTLPLPAEDAGTDVGPEVPPDRSCGALRLEEFACGGDPVGRWRVVQACLVAPAHDPLRGTCPDVEVEGSGDTGGSLEVRGDGTYALSLDAQTASLDMSFPLTCYGGSPASCDSDSFRGSCAVELARCRCALEINDAALVEAGEWTRYQELITAYPSSGDAYVSAFCRASRDTMLWLRYRTDARELTWAFVLEPAE